MAHPRLDASSVRAQYGTSLQAGLALSLASLLAIVHLPLPLDRKPLYRESESTRKQEAIDLRHVRSTRQAQAPPSPPTPPVPQVVPSEEIAESPSPEFEPSLGLGAASAQSGGVAARPDCGGTQSLRKKTYYPPSALDQGLEGRVLVEFVVGEDGDVESPRVVNGAHEILDQAALRAVRRLECAPGKRGSRPVRAEVTKPVVFALPQRMGVGRRH